MASIPRSTLDALRAHVPTGWSDVRVVPSDDAERGERTLIATARTRAWADYAFPPAFELRPYCVIHQNLIVGVVEVEVACDPPRVDPGRFVDRARIVNRSRV